MMRIKNWAKYQHYRGRRPPWIKLHRSLLDDPAWFCLRPDAIRALINMWLIASETHDGSLPDLNSLAFRLRFATSPERVTRRAIDKLTNILDELRDWIETAPADAHASATCDAAPAPRKRDAINPLALQQRFGAPETETETEREGEARARGSIDHRASTSNTARGDLKDMIDLVCARWDNWPRDQVEVSVMRLRQADPGLTLAQWREIVEEAYRTCAPATGTHRLHTWLARQVSIWRREKQRTQTETQSTATTHPSFREFDLAESTAPPPSPEEQRKIDEAKDKFFAVMRGVIKEVPGGSQD
jgi:hypothetical protein